MTSLSPYGTIGAETSSPVAAQYAADLVSFSMRSIWAVVFSFINFFVSAVCHELQRGVGALMQNQSALVTYNQLSTLPGSPPPPVLALQRVATVDFPAGSWYTTHRVSHGVSAASR